MAIKQITDANLTAGVHVPIVYVNEITNGLFIGLVLFAFWMIIAVGIYAFQKRQQGTGDFPVGVAIAGFLTWGAAILLRLVPGLVNNATYGVVIGVAIMGLFPLFFTRNK